MSIRTILTILVLGFFFIHFTPDRIARAVYTWPTIVYVMLGINAALAIWLYVDPRLHRPAQDPE